MLLLAEDCADLDPDLLDRAAAEWAKRERFFPKACELRDLARDIGKITRHDRILPPPAEKPKPVPPPLTDDEIRTAPEWVIEMGIKLGEIDPARAKSLRVGE